MTFAPGQIVGDYRIIGTLGRGGLGSVWEAKHLISQRSEALKVMLTEDTGTPEMKERFLREIQLLAKLDHPNIARLNSAFYQEERLVMAMEMVVGEDLRSRSRRTRIPLHTLLAYAIEVLSGLEYAHGKGVVHRDIKPANIMVTSTGSVKLLDFGIAQAGFATDLTVAGSLLGSPTHMSPEQARGGKATAQSDIYSLGVTLYELIAGQVPFQATSAYELLMAHVHQVPRPLKELRDDIPVELSDVIAKALEKEPSRRFASATQFCAAISEANGDALASTVTLSPTSSWLGASTDELNRPTKLLNESRQILAKQLAGFIGPIAKVVVMRLEKQTTDLDQLYALAAKEIETEGDRQRFLKLLPRPPVSAK